MMTQQYRHQAKQAGFTLMEVLIALAVLAIALGAIIQSVAANTSNAAYLRDRTLAHWVAMNRVAEMQVRNEWPAKGTDRGTEQMANFEWNWQLVVNEAGLDDIRQIQVEVRRNRNDKQALATIIALVGKPL